MSHGKMAITCGPCKIIAICILYSFIVATLANNLLIVFKHTISHFSNTSRKKPQADKSLIKFDESLPCSVKKIPTVFNIDHFKLPAYIARLHE